VTAHAAELRTSCRRFVCVAGRLSRRVKIVNFRVNEKNSNCTCSQLSVVILRLICLNVLFQFDVYNVPVVNVTLITLNNRNLT